MNDGTPNTTTVGEVLKASVYALTYALEPMDPPPTFSRSRGYPEPKMKKNHLFKNGGKKRR